VHLKARQVKRHVSKQGTVTERQMENCTQQGETKPFFSLPNSFPHCLFSLLFYTSLYLSAHFCRLFLFILFTWNRIQLSCFKL
jgi:hypothetical protein